MDKIVIIGGGGHAKVITSILKKIGGYDICGYVDIIDKGMILGIPYLGDDSVLLGLFEDKKVNNAAIGVGYTDNPELRMTLIEKTLRLDFSFPMIISPTAIINEDVVLGDGSVVMDGVVINSGTRIGKFAIVNTRSSVDHDCEIDDYAHIGPGAVLCGGVTIGKSVLVGAGVVVNQGISVSDNSIIGAGAVVTEDCNDAGTYVGIPAGRVK